MSRWRRSSSTARDPKAVPPVEDTFVGAKVPEILKAAVPTMHDMDVKSFGRILKSACQHLEEAGDIQDDVVSSAAARIYARSKESEIAVKVFTAVVFLMQRAVRNHVTTAGMDEDLAKLNLPSACREALVSALTARRATMQARLMQNRLRFPHVVNVDWRCDVTISTSAASRVLRPTILMQLTLSDGRIKTFEVPISEFHKLRYNVARVLKEMREVEAHPIMRLAFDFEAEAERKFGGPCVCKLARWIWQTAPRLANLHKLDLSANKLTTLPCVVFSLPALAHLDVSENLIGSLPDDAPDGPLALRFLSLAGNPLEDLPAWMRDPMTLPSLQLLDVTGSRLPGTVLDEMRQAHRGLCIAAS